MIEKLDLDALERALIGSAMGFTFRECQTLIKYARALESRASNAGGVHPDHLELLKPFMSERDGRLSHSLTVYLREMADPEFAERMHKARVRLYTATNAGGAVAWVVTGPDGKLDFLEEVYQDRDEGQQRIDEGCIPGCYLTPLYTHPAPASKEPVADELAMVRGVPKSIINAITAYGDARADSKDTGEAIGNAVSAIRAALATAQTPEVQKRLDEYVRLRDGTGGCTDGGCVIKRPTGMHTNGGCKCSHDKYKAMRMMYAGQQLADALLAAAPAKPEGV